jgi:predicted MPP superfamily phosphohydrolase
MRNLRILHISDLHMRSMDGPQSRRAGLEAAQRWRVLGPKWEENLNELCDERPFDIVAFTGDLGDRGHISDYPRAIEYLRAWCERLDVPLDRLFLVPGNHDIDRSIAEEAWKGLRAAAQARPLDVSSWMAGGATSLALDEKFRDDILRRQAAFRSAIANDLGLRQLLPSNSPHGRLGYKASIHLDGLSEPVHIIGLDSAWLSGDDNDSGNLLLTTHQIDQLCHCKEGRILPGLRLALMHHPIDELKDRIASRRSLADSVDLLLHGHQHEATSSFLSELGGRHLIALGAGCLYEGDQGERWPNWFQIIDIKLSAQARPEELSLHFRTWSAKGHFWANDSLLYKDAHNGRLTIKLSDGVPAIAPAAPPSQGSTEGNKEASHTSGKGGIRRGRAYRIVVTSSTILAMAIVAILVVTAVRQTKDKRITPSPRTDVSLPTLKDVVVNNWPRHMIIPLDVAPNAPFCEGKQAVPVARRTVQGVVCRGLKQRAPIEIDVRGNLRARDPMSRVPTVVSLVLNGTVCTAVDCRFMADLAIGTRDFQMTYRTYTDGNGQMTVLLDLTGCISARPPCGISVDAVQVRPLYREY